VGPDRTYIDPEYNSKLCRFRLFEVTPLYVGQFCNEFAKFESETVKIGGAIEGYGFALQGGLVPSLGLNSQDTLADLSLPVPVKGLDLCNAVSISSYNTGAVFDAVSVPFNGMYAQHNANYFSPAFEEAKMNPMLFADGSTVQKIPIISFIQRGVEKIIAVVSAYTPIDYEGLQDYDGPTSWMSTKQIKMNMIDISLASLFGITPSDHSQLTGSIECQRNHIFETEQFATLIKGEIPYFLFTVCNIT